MLRTWQRIVGSKVMAEIVNEHMPLDLAREPDQVVVGFAAFYLLLLLGTLPARPRVTWLIPLVWFVLTLKGIRQGPLFVIIAAVAIADLWPHTVWYRLLKKYGESLTRDPADTAAGPRLAGVRTAGRPRRSSPSRCKSPACRSRSSAPGGCGSTPGSARRPDRRGPGVRAVRAAGDADVQRRQPRRVLDLPRPGTEDLHGRPVRAVRRRVDRPTTSMAIRRPPGAVRGLGPARTGSSGRWWRPDDPTPPLEKYLREPGKWREVARGQIAVLFERVK